MHAVIGARQALSFFAARICTPAKFSTRDFRRRIVAREDARTIIVNRKKFLVQRNATTAWKRASVRHFLQSRRCAACVRDGARPG
jgi:hypothetical protein